MISKNFTPLEAECPAACYGDENIVNTGFNAPRELLTGFTHEVLSIVQKIPQGEVLTYKEVAKKAGRPNAYRAVGTILSKNYNPAIPCHRVVRSDGKIGKYNRGEEKKRALLAKEGALQ